MAQWTEADVAALKAAVASGILSVKYSGPPAREIQYQSLSEMRRLLAEMTADVATRAGTQPAYRLVSTKKGL